MGGLWSEGERIYHINLLELTAGGFAVKTIAHHRSNIDMYLKTNKTAIFYINKMGGTQPHLLTYTASLGSGASTEELHYQHAERLPGSSNITADQESWLLHLSEFSTGRYSVG